MHNVILHIGSNEGDRKLNLELALDLIQKKIGRNLGLSGVYETEAWGFTNQNSFLNQAIIIETELSATDLLRELMLIEDELGRIRHYKWGPRIIDIDIIFYDDITLDSDILTIPHPRMQERNFVLKPLNEIIPNYKHPILNKSISELTEDSMDSLSVLEIEG